MDTGDYVFYLSLFTGIVWIVILIILIANSFDGVKQSSTFNNGVNVIVTKVWLDFKLIKKWKDYEQDITKANSIKKKRLKEGKKIYEDYKKFSEISET